MPRINDRGVLIDVITNVDVTTVSGVLFKIQKPNLSTETWVGKVVSSGDGRLRHTSSGTELDQSGEYLVSPFLSFTDAKEFHTPAFRFDVTELYIP
jgi:hypothetical protein